MGLLDYYRQFEDMDESEVNAALRARRAREKALALERVPVLDLSHTESPDLPNAEVADGFVDPAGLLAQVGDRTRLIVISNPNDPTGTYLESGQVGELLSRLPEHAYLALDEAYVHFQDVEEEDGSMRLVEAFPRLLVFRTFSKAYGLSGVRAGYVVGAPSATSLLASIAPALGVNALTQAAVLQA